MSTRSDTMRRRASAASSSNNVKLMQAVFRHLKILVQEGSISIAFQVADMNAAA